VSVQVVEPMMLKRHYLHLIVPMSKVTMVVVFSVIHLFHQYMTELSEEILLHQVQMMYAVILVVVLYVLQMNDVELIFEQTLVVALLLSVDSVAIENDVLVL
jgi:hypothetical protein